MTGDSADKNHSSFSFSGVSGVPLENFGMCCSQLDFLVEYTANFSLADDDQQHLILTVLSVFFFFFFLKVSHLNFDRLLIVPSNLHLKMM